MERKFGRLVSTDIQHNGFPAHLPVSLFQFSVMCFRLERSHLHVFFFFLDFIPLYSILILLSSLDLKSFVDLDKMLTSLILKYFILLETVYRKKNCTFQPLMWPHFTCSVDPGFFLCAKKKNSLSLGLSLLLFLLLLTSQPTYLAAVVSYAAVMWQRLALGVFLQPSQHWLLLFSMFQFVGNGHMDIICSTEYCTKPI